MTQESLSGVLAQIVELLRSCGQEEKALWLDERKLILDSSATAPAQQADVLLELHNVVLGMGGLMDLVLKPRDGSSETAVSARHRLDLLADALYQMTR